MYNETTGTDVSKKDKKETFEEFIARKKKEFLTEKSVIKPPLFESLRGVPFGPSGLSIMEARLWNEMMNEQVRYLKNLTTEIYLKDIIQRNGVRKKKAWSRNSKSKS